MANAKIKKKRKRKKLLQKWDVDFWRGCIFFSDLSWPSLQQHFFPVFVLSQTLTNAARHIPLKWTNAIRMHLALIPRAHTTVLVILRLLEMVLIVKVSLVFEDDEIFILFPALNVAVNCLEFTLIRHSHRGGIILRSLEHKNESTFDYKG